MHREYDAVRKVDSHCLLSSPGAQFTVNSTLSTQDQESQLDHINKLLPELILQIFDRKDLQILVSLNRNWYRVVDNFRENLFSDSTFKAAFRAKDYIEIFGVNPGKEPPLPLCVFMDYEEGDLLTFMTDSVEITDEKGNVTKKGLNLPLMDELVKNSNSKHKTRLDNYSYKGVINDLRTCKGRYWVLIKRKVIGGGKYFEKEGDENQIGLAKEQGHSASVSELLDTVWSVFARKAMTGEWCLTNDSANVGCDRIRVNNKVNNLIVALSSHAFGLHVWRHIDQVNDHVYVAVGRKSIAY